MPKKSGTPSKDIYINKSKGAENKMTRETPCDWGDCPYNAMYSEDCRYHCGLGVDEDSYPDEDEEVT